MRVFIAFGIAAFSFSFILGIFARADFFMLLLRALLAGIFSSGLSIGAYFILDNFLPEFFNSSDFNIDAGMENSTGKAVDIVLDDDEAAREMASVQRKAELFRNPFGDAPESRKSSLEGDAESLKDDPILLKEENEGESESDEDNSSIPLAVQNDLDVLPDLEGLSDTFIQPLQGDGDFQSDDRLKSAYQDLNDTPSQSTTRSSGSSDGRDTETIVKAVRTLMARDKKG